MSEQVKTEILAEVNSTTSLSEAAATLSNALSLQHQQGQEQHDPQQQQQPEIDYTQQTLMDVNSQPLMHSLLESHQHHPLLGHHSAAMNATDTDLLNANAAVAAAAMMKHIAGPRLSATPITVASSSSVNTAAFSSPAPPPTNANGNSSFTDNCAIEITGNTLDPSSPIIIEFYERFAVGRMFQSLEELRTEAFEYGRKHNVALTTSKSDKTKVYLICKHGGFYRKNNKKASDLNQNIKPRLRRSQKTGCACMIYARCCRGSFWVIRKCIGEHNHPIAEDPRAYAMYRSLSPEHLLVVHRLLREHVGVTFIVKSLRANGVTNILAKDIENIQQDLKRRDVLDLPIDDGTRTEAQNNILIAAAEAAAEAAAAANNTAVGIHQYQETSEPSSTATTSSTTTAKSTNTTAAYAPCIPAPADTSIVATIPTSSIMMTETSKQDNEIASAATSSLIMPDIIDDKSRVQSNTD
ncbi:hypothetical protein MAM1_0110c05549 [Mucor ambiguus]|uniref:FAR1 domain-containing protein n=1 Tax=Mucor ambiguus TaxID=91626 RepID=A0A0C9MRX0_9FUNG|nr:hypothetical protein MAM1_0110c05549 [Mucor ambiguus]